MREEKLKNKYIYRLVFEINQGNKYFFLNTFLYTKLNLSVEGSEKKTV